MLIRQGDRTKTTPFHNCTSISWETLETDHHCRTKVVRKWQSKERNKKCHRMLWDLKKVQKATTKTMCIVSHVTTIPRVDWNGPIAIWSLLNFIYYWSLHTSVSINFHTPQKKRHNHERILSNMGSVEWLSAKSPSQQWGRICQRWLSINDRRPWNQCFNYSCRTLMEHQSCWKALPGTHRNDGRDNKRHQMLPWACTVLGPWYKKQSTKCCWIFSKSTGVWQKSKPSLT